MADGDPPGDDGMIAAAGRASAAVGLVPVGLIVVAEAAWISVVGGLLQEFVFREPVLGIPAFAIFLIAGIVAARLLGRRLGARWPAAALLLIAAAGITGWLASPAARDALDGGLGPALAAHPGGWVAGLAMLRGFAHARLPLVEDTVARLLGLGVPGLAICAIIGGVVVEPFRGRFLADGLATSIVFVVAATLALAITRLSEVGSDGGFDWRRNPAWLGLTVALLGVAIVVALPLSVVAGTAIEAVFAIALGPLLLLGLLTGLDRTVRKVLGLIFGAGAIVLIVVRLFAQRPSSPNPTPGAAAGQGQPSVAEQMMTISLGGFLLILTIVTILILAAVWLERSRPPGDDLLDETRTIDRGLGDPAPRRRRPWFRRRAAPTEAAAAYVALIRDLEAHPDVRRGPAETPAEHAARLRSGGRAALSLDLLAADYALARYGGLSLPEREDRRAVRRWRTLRRWLPKAGDGIGPDGLPQPEPDRERMATLPGR